MSTPLSQNEAAAPETARVSVSVPLSDGVLAFGADLKNTVCTGIGSEALIYGPHGDLSQPEAYRSFLKTVASLQETIEDDSCVIVHDLHPGYLSTIHAQRQTQPKVSVQHHHAHAVSCAVDAHADLPVVGVVCDGTGFGTDGAIWGGEVLLCDDDSFRRMAHFDYFPLPGGDAAARDTWRPALSLTRETLGQDCLSTAPAVFESVDSGELGLVAQQLGAGLNTTDTSSLGRLFDAVAFLAGVCDLNSYEGQAGQELQAAAQTVRDAEAYSFEVLARQDPARIDWRNMIREIINERCAGVDAAIIAGRFHKTVVEMLESAACAVATKTGVSRVVLSGGCFFNALLRDGLSGRLTTRGLEVYMHQRVSPGDAGLSLGQARIGSAMASRRIGNTQGT